MYPGVAYASVKDIALMARFIQGGNHFLYFRADGVLLDGRLRDGRSGQIYNGLLRRHGLAAAQHTRSDHAAQRRNQASGRGDGQRPRAPGGGKRRKGHHRS